MKVRYGLYGLAIGNVVFLAVLGLIALGAYINSQSDPEPIFGDWKTFTDSFDDYLIKQFDGFSVATFDETKPFPTGSYNRTFVKAVLKLKINSSDVVTFRMGVLTVEYLYDIRSGIVTMMKDYYFWSTGGYPSLSLRASFLKTTLSWTHQQLPKFRANYFRLNNTHYQDVYYYPCIYWTAGANVSWEYSEIWKYIPLTGYDYTIIENAQATLSSLPLYFCVICICDFLIFCSLAGLALSQKRGCPTPILEPLESVKPAVERFGD